MSEDDAAIGIDKSVIASATADVVPVVVVVVAAAVAKTRHLLVVLGVSFCSSWNGESTITTGVISNAAFDYLFFFFFFFFITTGCHD